jgi:hypothetical protein
MIERKVEDQEIKARRRHAAAARSSTSSALKKNLETAAQQRRRKKFESALDVTFREAWCDEGPKEYGIPRTLEKAGELGILPAKH